MTAIRSIAGVFVVMILVTAIENEPLDVFDAFHCLMIATRQPIVEIRMHFSIVVCLEIVWRRNDNTKTKINKIFIITIEVSNHYSMTPSR